MIANLKPYAAMKSSGVPWLGEVPEHWSVARLKEHLVRNDSGVWGDDVDARGTVVLRSTEQTVDGGWRISNPATIRLSEAQHTAAVLAPGDLVVTRSSGSVSHIGKTSLVSVAIARLDCCFSNFMQRLRMDGATDPGFVWHVLNCPVGREQLVFQSTTTTGLGNLTGTILGNCVFPFPQMAEQAAIVGFLDYADGRIRRYIRAKQQLIKLLQEQRRVIIHRAVTRGLDPNARLRSSGVPWLGDIPEHWNVTPLKAEFVCLNNRRIPLSGTERGKMTLRQYPYYGASGVIDQVDDYLFDDDLLLIAEDGANLVLRSLPLAIVARGKFWVNNHAHILKPRRGNLEYLAALMETLNYQPWISGAAQPKLTKDRLMSIAIAVPPRPEQDAIVESVGTDTAPLRTTIDRARREISLLHEYRTRLIADVVTGKLDVRQAAAVLPDALEKIDEADREEVVVDDLADEDDAELEEVEA